MLTLIAAIKPYQLKCLRRIYIFNTCILYIYFILKKLNQEEQYVKMKQAMKEQLNCFLPLGIEGVVAAGTGTASGTATGTGAGPRLGARLLRAAQEALDARPGQELGCIVPLCECGQRPRKYTRTMS